MKKFFFALVFILSISALIFTEDGSLENFDFDDEENSSESSVFSINFGGSFYAGTEIYFDTFKKSAPKLPFPLWGRLYLEAKSPLAEAYASVNLTGKTLSIEMGETAEVFPKQLFPKWIDEVYVQALAGPVVLGGGVKKVNWGRADFFSILDIVNPKDLSKPYEFYPGKIKKASPVFFLSAYLPKEMKLEFVYLPVFETDEFALDGRWEQPPFENITNGLPASPDNAALAEARKKLFLNAKNADNLEYSQGGLRYTLSIAGKHDLGFQYFTGFFHEPNFKSDYKPSASTETEFKKVFDKDKAKLICNRYHQIGADYEAMFGKFTVQAEFAANISSDLKGNNPDIYNPHLAWNLGLLYALPKNINLRLQAAENIRLLNSGINQNELSLDTEKKRPITDTRLLFSLSQTLMRGSLEWKLNALVGIEDADFMINPELSWLIGTIGFDLGLGFFGGKKTGKLGRYQNNHFIKISIGYEF